MNLTIPSFSIYMLPPLLSFAVGLTLALISIVKGKLEAENILFSLVCLWLSMLSPVFILHYFMRDVATIMIIERTFHFFYVFIIPITVLFFHNILNVRRRAFEISLFIISAVFAALTPTGYYLTGLYEYHWGHIARGGIAFELFGLYCIIGVAYGIITYAVRIRVETNQIVRRKLNYMLLSITIIGVLTLLNIPAMNGIDLYPAGNFMFVPLSIMGYGVLQYRLLDITSILHKTLMWSVISSAIIVPNIFIFGFLHSHFGAMLPYQLFIVLVAWFSGNYFYFQRIQPLINYLFNRQKFNLRKIELQFLQDISFLKNLTTLIRDFEDTLQKTLAVRFAGVYLREGETLAFGDTRGNRIELHPDIVEWFSGADHMVERNMAGTNPYYGPVRDVFLDVFERYACDFIVPLVQNQAVIGVVFMGEKKNHDEISADEVHFINDIRAAVTISLSNSIMYQNLNDLKDNLEKIVEERTRMLEAKNSQMLFELKVASDVQKLILSPELPRNESIYMAARLRPLMEVSGDFYHAVKISDWKIGVAIVDVSGHGVPSALLTSMIKTEIENRLKGDFPDTGSVCTAINKNLTPTLLETGFYFTMFLCVIDLAASSVGYTNCGHDAPFIVSPDGDIARLSADGLPVGADVGASYTNHSAAFRRSDRIYLYTDGITEARNTQSEFFGEPRLIGLIRDTMPLSVDEQLEHIIGEVERYQEGIPATRRDDMTLMIIEIGKPPVVRAEIKEAMRHFKERRYGHALEIIRALNISAMSDAHLYFASRVCFKVNDFDGSLRYIDSALSRNPANIEYLYLKGMVLYKRGDREKASEVLGRVCALDPGYKNAAQALERLKA